MKLLRTASGPPTDATVICRQSRFSSLAVALAFFGVFLVLPLAAWLGGQLPGILAASASVVGLILIRIAWSDAHAALLDSNWVFALGPGGVWLNLRSYRNYRFIAAETVVHFSFDELEYARKEVVRRSEDMGDSRLRWQETSLVLRPLVPDLDRLSDAVDAESNRKHVAKLLGGLVTSSGRSHHIPVRVTLDGLLQVLWKSRNGSVHPKVDEVLTRLGKYIRVQTEPVDSAAAQLD